MFCQYFGDIIFDKPTTKTEAVKVVNNLPRTIVFGLLVAAALAFGVYSWSSLGGGYSGRPAFLERTMLPSELAANPDKYDGKHVNVRGYVVLGPESRNVADSEASYYGRGACLGLDGPETMFTRFRHYYTKNISGVFRRKLCGDRDVCLYWCSVSGIVLDKHSQP